ncbi:MAG: tRNA (guanosine(37)-N1)-methyltransferase TrmD [Alphaproteobacteria bacterium]|nr:MAG: tRNA (guanosine(37)-N1)-methyltransferase TrmD [Alphaproteobacteria bacterium]
MATRALPGPAPGRSSLVAFDINPIILPGGKVTDKPRSLGRLSITASARPRPLSEKAPPAGVWQARVLTLYPQMFPGALGEGVIGRALAEGLWALAVTDIRDFALDRHRSVDDTPAGGGPGMVMRADVLGRAIDHAMAGCPPDRARWPLIALSPRGRPFSQARAAALARAEGVTLICGRFEGIDQRVLDARGVEELSIGDYVLAGGELAAQVLIEASVRLIPRVLGNAESQAAESFSEGLLEYPQYTRPQVWEGREIPEVLLSGHHARIAAWRRQRAEALTRERRPDLWRARRQEIAEGPKGEPEQSDATGPAQPAGQQKDEGHEPS